MAIWTIRHPEYAGPLGRARFWRLSAWRLVKTTLNQQQLRG